MPRERTYEWASWLVAPFLKVDCVTEAHTHMVDANKGFPDRALHRSRIAVVDVVVIGAVYTDAQ